MQKNVFDYLEYSWTKLFSKQFTNIVGTSLVVSVVSFIIPFLLLISGGFAIAKNGIVLPDSAALPSWILSGLTFTLMFVIFMILARAWQAIVIPIRSIDESTGMSWKSDLALFRSHIWRYLGYLTWYSLFFLVVWILYIVGIIVMSALDTAAGIFFGIIGAIGLIYLSTLFYVAWYHVLSEGSGGWRMFWDSKKYIIGKAWGVFWKVLGFSIIVGIVSNMIDSFIYGLFSFQPTSGAFDEIAKNLSRTQTLDTTAIQDILDIIVQHPVGIFGTWILLAVIMSLSSILSKAMFHIFYVRYYLDLRDEYDRKSSSLGPVPRKHMQ